MDNLKKTEYVYFSGPRGQGEPPGVLTIGGERVKWVEGVRFLGMWVDRGLSWVDHIQGVTVKTRQLLGIMGRASGVLNGGLLLSLYNGMVLPHLQYCLMVWGDFEAGRNKTRGEALLRLQKRFVGLMAGKRGIYHADPLFARFGVLKVGDLYRQQVRVHAWKFWNGRLPENQAAMLQRVDERHGHGTRTARGGGLALSSGDHRVVGYRQGCRLFFLPHSKILVRISAADCVYATTFRNTVFALNKCPNCLFISLGVSVYLKNLKNNIKQSKPTENETIVIIVHK